MNVNLAVLGTQPIKLYNEFSKRFAVPIANLDSTINVVEGDVMDIMLYVSIMTNEIPTNEFKLYICKGEMSFELCCLDVNDFKVHTFPEENTYNDYKCCLIYSGISYNIPFEPTLGFGDYVIALTEVNDNSEKLLVTAPIHVQPFKE